MTAPRTNAEDPVAVVIGLDCITGLQTARLLAQRGVPVIGIAKNRRHYCCRTRVCRTILTADTSSEDLVRCLEDLGPSLPQRAVLFPSTDMSVLMVSRGRRRLRPWYHVMLGDPRGIEMLTDKIRFIAFAQENGLPIPRTAVLNDRDAAERAAAELTFPCVLKPPVKTPRWAANTNIKAYRVATGEELLALYDRCSAWSDTLLVQEWIEGPESNLYSCNAYFDAHSKPLVTFVARKLRQWPPGNGTSCLGEECHNDELLRETAGLFQTANFRGLAYLEMKRDERTGELLIIEPNVGRPTGRSAIAEAGGVELVYTMYCDAVGRPLPEARRQQYGGVKWIHWRRDLQSAWHYWRRGELTVGQWWRSWRGPKGCAVFNWSDPAPFLADFMRAARLSLGRAGRAVWSRLAAKHEVEEKTKRADDRPARYPAIGPDCRRRRGNRVSKYASPGKPRGLSRNRMTPRIKRRLMSATRSPSFGRFVELLERLGDRNTNLLRVLTYHRVDEPAARSDLYPGLISATPAEFARQMDYLASACHAVGMEEVVHAVRGDGQLPPRSVLITFDDAYCDFAEHAWPVLRRHGLPATMFVPTAYPGGTVRSFWWDRLYHAVHSTDDGECLTTPIGSLPLECEDDRNLAVRQLLRYANTLPHHELRELIDQLCRQRFDSPLSGSVLSWEQLRRLAGEGLTLAAHTRTHPLLNRVTLDEARREAVQSREELAGEIGPTLPVFAYPGGALSGEVVSMLRREGFELALTTCRGVNDLRRVDPLRLRRINVGRQTTTSLLRAQLLPDFRHCNFCWPAPDGC